MGGCAEGATLVEKMWKTLDTPIYAGFGDGKNVDIFLESEGGGGVFHVEHDRESWVPMG